MQRPGAALVVRGDRHVVERAGDGRLVEPGGEEPLAGVGGEHPLRVRRGRDALRGDAEHPPRAARGGHRGRVERGDLLRRRPGHRRRPPLGEPRRDGDLRARRLQAARAPARRSPARAVRRASPAAPTTTSRTTSTTTSSKRRPSGPGPRSGSTMQSIRAAKGCAERSSTPRRTTASTPVSPTRDSAGRTAAASTGAPAATPPRLQVDLPRDVRQPAAGHRHDRLADVVGQRVAPGLGRLLGPGHDALDEVRRRLAVDQAAQAEADVPALVELDVVDALAHARQGAVVQVLEQRALPGGEHHALEGHVVERHPVVQAGAALRHLRGHGGKLVLEEVDDPGRGDLPRGLAALRLRLPRQLEHLGGDAVEEPRVALLVALLQEDDPRDQRVVGRRAERREVLGDGVVGDPEAGQQLREPLAAVVGELRRTPRRRGRGRCAARPTAASPRRARRSSASGWTAGSARPPRLPGADAIPSRDRTRGPSPALSMAGRYQSL